MTSKKDPRLEALQRFAIAITAFNVLGHTWFGFEQSIAHPLTALAAAYFTEILLEWLDSRHHGRRARYLGGPRNLINFLLSAHISALAVAMLLYSGERLAPVGLAAVIAIGSKYFFRVAIGKGSRHFFNPSNLGITLTLLLFPWVGIAQPYMFTENLSGIGDWIVPAFIVLSGSFLNARYTKRIPLILAWLGAFALQAVIRNLLFGTSMVSGLLPMTGVAFILFTFYMVTDPATTPFSRRGQILFGAGVAFSYGLLMSFHIVFGLFFGLTLTCTVRGVAIGLSNLAERRRAVKAEASPLEAAPLEPAPSSAPAPTAFARADLRPSNLSRESLHRESLHRDLPQPASGGLKRNAL